MVRIANFVLSNSASAPHEIRLTVVNLLSNSTHFASLMERVVFDPYGKVIRVELLPPFAYLHPLSDRVGGREGSSNRIQKNKNQQLRWLLFD